METKTTEGEKEQDKEERIHIGERGSLIVESTRRRKAILNDIEKQIMRDSQQHKNVNNSIQSLQNHYLALGQKPTSQTTCPNQNTNGGSSRFTKENELLIKNSQYDKSELACHISDSSIMIEDDLQNQVHLQPSIHPKNISHLQSQQVNQKVKDVDFEEALFEYGQDPNDPYDKSNEPQGYSNTTDGFEELFVRDNIHRIPSNLDNLAQSEKHLELEDGLKKKKKKRRNNKCKRSKQNIGANERGLVVSCNLIQIEIHPFIPLKQQNIEDNSNYTIPKKKNSSVTSNILYDLLMKYNGFYNERELEQLPQEEIDSFKSHIEKAHDLANDNSLIKQTLLQMELKIKEKTSNYTKIALEKHELLEELSISEEVSRTLNRDKMQLDEDIKHLQDKFILLKKEINILKTKDEVSMSSQIIQTGSQSGQIYSFSTQFNAAMKFVGLDQINIEEVDNQVIACPVTQNQKRRNKLLQRKRDKLKQIEHFFDNRLQVIQTNPILNQSIQPTIVQF